MSDVTSFIFPKPEPVIDPERLSYVHDQGTPSDSWVIAHNLGYHPTFVVVDSAGTQVEGEPTYISVDILQIDFSFAFGGKAYLS